jgi:hypothetical protein
LPGASRRWRACHAAGLVVLTCGTFSNVLRFRPPLVIGDDLLEEGPTILEDAFGLPPVWSRWPPCHDHGLSPANNAVNNP